MCLRISERCRRHEQNEIFKETLKLKHFIRFLILINQFKLKKYFCNVCKI